MTESSGINHHPAPAPLHDPALVYLPGFISFKTETVVILFLEVTQYEVLLLLCMWHCCWWHWNTRHAAPSDQDETPAMLPFLTTLKHPPHCPSNYTKTSAMLSLPTWLCSIPLLWWSPEMPHLGFDPQSWAESSTPCGLSTELLIASADNEKK